MSKMIEKIKLYIYINVAFLIFSTTGIVSKFASKTEFFSVKFLLLLSIELFIFFIFALIWQQIIKRLDITKAYSFRALVIIWTLVWAVLIFKEEITLNNIVGIVIIISGIMLVNKNDK